MNAAEKDVRQFYQTHTRSQLATEILKREDSLNETGLSHDEELARQSQLEGIEILRDMMSQFKIPLKWYSTVSEIPRDISINYIDEERICILEAVELSLLINSLGCGNKEALLNGQVDNQFDQQKIDGVSLLIKSELKLIPPFISYHERTGSLILEDGRHRLRAAVLAEQSHIPIIIFKNDYNAIFRLLIF